MLWTTLLVLGQPSIWVRVPGIWSGLVTSIAFRPAGGGRIPPANELIPVVQSPPKSAFGVCTPPNCTSTGSMTGVVMLPMVIEPLFTCPSEHMTAEPDTPSFMRGLSIGQLVNGL